MTLEEILDDLETHGEKKTDRLIWQTALMYYGSILLNALKIKKDEEIDSHPHIRFFGMIVSGSGSGKDFSAKSIEKLMPLSSYRKKMKASIHSAYSKLPEYNVEEKEEILNFLPTGLKTNVEGTPEGLFMVALAQRTSEYGSLNLFNSEFSDVIESSRALLDRLKQLYDGEMGAKVIKGSELTNRYEDLEDVICNLLVMTTPKGFSTAGRKNLEQLVSSGIYRRTIIVDTGSEIRDIEMNDSRTKKKQLKEWFETITLSNLEKRKSINKIQNLILPHTEEYKIESKKIMKELVNRRNEDRLDDLKEHDTGAKAIIVDLSYIIAFLENANQVDITHLFKAKEFFYESRESSYRILKPQLPHKIMFKILNERNGLTITEMADIDNSVPVKATAIADAISNLKEMCYIHNKHLKIATGAVVRYSVDDLPVNKLDEIILSLSTDDRGAHCIDYRPVLIQWEDVPKLVVSEKVDSFTCCHYEPTRQAAHGHRKQETFIEEQNLIAFDIDEKMSIAEVQEILEPYTYLIYTTKSHQIDKNDLGVICDRFRILMPTKVKFYVTPDQHKLMYENLEIMLGITANDVKTRNVSRMFFTNPGSTIFENQGDLIDVGCCIPDTISSNHIIPNLENVAQMESTGEMGKREAGFLKWFLANTSEGNRNNNTYQAIKFYQDIGMENIPYKIEYMNAMLENPLPESEIHKMLKAHRVI